MNTSPSPRQMLLRLVRTERLTPHHVLLRLRGDESLIPPPRAGQFVEVKVPHAPSTFLRRPISVNYFDADKGELWLLVHEVGEGTRTLGELREGDHLDCILPLGKGFRDHNNKESRARVRILLVGGGVGTAPLLYYGAELRRWGLQPQFLLGGRTKADILQLDDFRRLGPVHLTTEDGSEGVRGFVTAHPALAAPWTHIATCGPRPMMWAVAREARARGIDCEVSLENMMACGLGACLCCVEETTEGNLCACKDGPVFNAAVLKL